MKRKTILARLLVGFSGKSQKALAKELGVHRSLLGHFQQGRVEPAQEYLKRLAAAAGLTPAQAEEILRLYEGFRLTRDARSRSAEEVLDGLTRSVRAVAETTYRRVLPLPLADAPASAEREVVGELWDRLQSAPERTRADIVRVAREFQSWALCERVCADSVIEASRDVKRSASLAQLALEIAEHVPGPESWRQRVQGYAAAHVANTLRVKGDLEGAEATFTAAKRLWQAGSDPSSVLDPGRLADLEASLRIGQRRFAEALALLDEALALGRSPARVLVNKGSTLEVMGEYDRAIETLLQAVPLVERQGDRRLMNILNCNLGCALCHTGRFDKAAELAAEVRACAAEMGDHLLALRGLWLQGRVAAGLGQREEALSLLAQARREFALREMDYDVALALLEEAALLLDQGRTQEVKALASELACVFRSKGVHREALAALRLFQQAAEREDASADLARRVLHYLFRARYDQGLRFTP